MGRPDALHELVARSADRAKQSAAIRQGELAVTYAELQALAVQLAAELACAGVGEERVVALDLPSSPRMIAAMLAAGILGAAFLPLDRRDTPERRAALVADAGAVAVVTEYALHTTDADTRLEGRPAYLTYRAGVTARLRPMVAGQRAAVDHIENAVAEYRLRPSDRQLQLASPALEFAIEEIFSTLTASATLVLPDAEFGYEDVVSLLRLVDERGGTILTLPTSVHDAFGRELRRSPHLLLPRALRLVAVGRQAAAADARAAWHAAAREATFRVVRAVGPASAPRKRPVSLTS
ncbi:AMP-binding protein [Actinospica robiniae]|uniref:AMP-binding protein n=1 Tax=Actinospica robiniae TaxID=304901 RepID=UPI0003F80C61|nr:AMP-binding protein [Actinospica robiniae]